MPIRQAPLIPGEYYHIYNRGINSETVFRTNRNYAFFLRRIEEILLPQTVALIAYVLIPTHYHMLVRIKTEDFSPALGRLINSYTKAYNRDWVRTGPLFEGRFKAKHVDTDEYLLELSRYIHLNPVSANLVTKPEDWLYSSYAAIIGLKSETLIVTELIYSYFDQMDPIMGYQQFVEETSTHKLDRISHLLFD